MNKLNGTINKITKIDSLVLLDVIVKGEDKHTFTSLLLDNNDIGSYKIDENVNIIFKETEVMIATPESKVSARNSFLSSIFDIEIGELLCNITFNFDNYKVNSIITKSAYLELKCEKDTLFRWFVKANEVIIQKLPQNERI